MAQEERLISTRVGEVAITPDRVLRFPRGLIGFERHKEFTLIQLREDSPFMVLQSLDDPSFGLLVADPYSFMPEYEVLVGEADRRLLNIVSMEEVGILVTVSIPQGQPDRTTLNLSGPIVVNFKDRVGLQAPQTGTNYPSHYVPGMTPNKKDHAPDPSPSDAGPDPDGSAGEGR